jgi:hypothetical protein
MKPLDNTGRWLVVVFLVMNTAAAAIGIVRACEGHGSFVSGAGTAMNVIIVAWFAWGLVHARSEAA